MRSTIEIKLLWKVLLQATGILLACVHAIVALVLFDFLNAYVLSLHLSRKVLFIKTFFYKSLAVSVLVLNHCSIVAVRKYVKGLA